MNGNARMSPRKVIIAVVITGMIIIASVGGVFITMNSLGMMTAEISIYGQVSGTNASSCFLYVDGVKVATFNFIYSDNYGYNSDYDGYNDRYFSFYSIKVKANTEHEFQVITSDGEESITETLYTQFADSTDLTINITKPLVVLNIMGNYTGNVSCYIVTCYVDNENVGSSGIDYPNQLCYGFTARVYENGYHIIRLEANLNYTGFASNQATIYVGTETVNYYMDIDNR